jgi:hypothetical protein
MTRDSGEFEVLGYLAAKPVAAFSSNDERTD